MTRLGTARPRVASLGAALAPDRVLVLAQAGDGTRRWSHPVAADAASPPRAAADALAAAIHDALEALGATRARLAIALLPPLVECRFVEMPGLSDDEVQLVLARDAASWFPSCAGASVVAARRVAAASDGRVMVAAAPAALVDALHASAASAGATIDALVPAQAAWAGVLSRAWRVPDGVARCRLVIPLGARTEVLTVDDGEPVALRRLPCTTDHRFTCAALDDDAATVPVALAGEAALVAPLAAALAARGTPTLAVADDTAARDPVALAAAGAWQRAPQLVPDSMRAERRRLATRSALRRAAVALALLVVAAGVGLWGTRRELDAVRTRRAELRASLGGVLATRDTLAMVTDRLATLRAAEGGARRWSVAVALLAARLPRDAWLVSLRAEGDSLVVEGAARRAAPVLDALGRDAAVLAVRAQGSIRQETLADAEPVERFTLSVRLMPEALASSGLPSLAMRAGGVP